MSSVSFSLDSTLNKSIFQETKLDFAAKSFIPRSVKRLRQNLLKERTKLCKQ